MTPLGQLARQAAAPERVRLILGRLVTPGGVTLFMPPFAYCLRIAHELGAHALDDCELSRALCRRVATDFGRGPWLDPDLDPDAPAPRTNWTNYERRPGGELKRGLR